MGFDFNQLVSRDSDCSCGRRHSSDVRHIDVGAWAINRLPVFVKEHGFKKAFVVADLNTWYAAGHDVEIALQEVGIETAHIVLQYKEPIPNEQVIGELVAAFPQDTDIVVCAGSGTLNDLCKFLSFRTKVEYVVLASAPSMDGYLAIGAPLILNHMKRTIDTHGPLAVFGDTLILSSAPKEMINAGVGDVLGKYTALLDWRLSHLINGEYICDETVELVRHAIDEVADNIHGVAYGDINASQKVMEGLLATGIAMAWIGNSRPAAGCEHHMSHVMELSFQMDGKKAVLHGVKVGISLLACVYMYQLLAEEDIDFDAARARSFSRTDWLEFTRSVYRDAAPEIISLEIIADSNDIDARNRRIDAMEREWPRIRQMIKDELPPLEQLEQMFKEIGAPTRPSEAGIGIDLFCDAIRAGKDVRTRWTMLQMLWDLGLDTKYAELVRERFA